MLIDLVLVHFSRCFDEDDSVHHTESLGHDIYRVSKFFTARRLLLRQMRVCVCMCATPPRAYGPFRHAKSIREAFHLAPIDEQRVGGSKALIIPWWHKHYDDYGISSLEVNGPISDQRQRSRSNITMWGCTISDSRTQSLSVETHKLSDGK